MEPLAHSKKPEKKIPAQTYAEHIIGDSANKGVLPRALINAENSGQYNPNKLATLKEAVRLAALYHDLGKLDEENQAILNQKCKGKLINHVDAGVRQLLKIKKLNSAFLVYTHHIGLQSMKAEINGRGEYAFRDEKIAERTNKKLNDYLDIHNKTVLPGLSLTEKATGKFDTLLFRLALSCLVDADHGNTAYHYGNETSFERPEPRWKDRLSNLNKYIKELEIKSGKSERNMLRSEIYDACKNADVSQPIYACDSPVGTGKTTAIMAHLLQAAIKKDLRHIIVVLPYTSIIKQSVEIYRKALVLSGENPEDVIAEHHHQADFADLETRQLATLWASPIIVTTAVQFFESLGSNHPSRLRKIHELPGSGVFIDEAHAAIPTWLWPQAWIWLKKLANEWCCHFVLSSGSLPRFWKIEKFVESNENIPDLLPKELQDKAYNKEIERVSKYSYKEVLNRDTLADFVLKSEGPRLLVMNTVQSAAVMAKIFKERNKEVYHISTALTPIDRGCIIEKVSSRLKNKNNADWLLVATSCVEAGMDFSFQTAFRESCSACSLIQISGRVNRHDEKGNSAVWDFRVNDPLLKQHPSFDTARNVLNGLFIEGIIQNRSATETVSEAMRRELMTDYNAKTKQIIEKEKKYDFPEVAKLCQVILSNTKPVLINPVLINRLENYEKVSPIELVKNSVQIWCDKIKELCLHPVNGMNEIYKWHYKYDPEFLGYIAGIWPLIEAEETKAIFY
jgi:CRISPR-associated endonuclease/helicase Cas3